MMLNGVLTIMIIGRETVEKRLKDALTSSLPSLQLTTANGRHIEAIVQDCTGQQVVTRRPCPPQFPNHDGMDCPTVTNAKESLSNTTGSPRSITRHIIF
jgi:hypothetical protein